LLVAFLASGPLADAAVAYYLTAYVITTLGAFGVVGMLSQGDRDADRLADYHGLAWRRPWPAAVMTAMLLSLAGIPLTAGFVGKFYILAVGTSSRLWWLVLILVVNSAIGLFYYLRVMIVMFAPATSTPLRLLAEDDLPHQKVWALSLANITLIVLTIAVVWLGVDPAPLIRTIAGLALGRN
jgi:NADH-quinone oxidoreductase subunit N